MSRVLFKLEIVGTEPGLVSKQSAGAGRFEVKPSLRKSLDVKLQSICTYEEGTKVALEFRNRGATPLENLAIDFGPDGVVAAGKRNLRCPKLDSGHTEQIELIVAQNRLEMVMAANLNGKRSEWRDSRAVEPVHLEKPQRFRFLEPRRLSTDSIRIEEADSKQSARQDHSTYLLNADSKYHLRIKPAHEASSVKLEEIRNVVHVRRTECERGEWIFTLEVFAPQILRRPERLFYEVVAKEGKLSGEVPICVRRTFWQFGAKASEWGFLSLASGLYGMWVWLKGSGEFEFFDLVRILGIPGLLLAYWSVDCLQYHFRK